MGGDTKIVVKTIDIIKTITVDTLVKDILQSPEMEFVDGINRSEMHKLLKDKFGIAENSVSDIIEVIQSELDLHCPDNNKHLQFVETSNA